MMRLIATTFAALSAALSADPAPADTYPWSATPVASQAISADVPAEGIVMEDDPRWDCRTMGNRVCGPANDGEA